MSFHEMMQRAASLNANSHQGLNRNGLIDVVDPIKVQPHVTKGDNYQIIRNEDIRNELSKDGYDKLLQPSDMELSYVNSVFQSKGWHLIDNVTFAAVHAIGDQEFKDLNNRLREFTKSLNGVDNAGLFSLIDDLSKEVKDSDLEGIWNKATNAKPTLLAHILALFDKNAKSKSVMNQLSAIGDNLQGKSGNLDKKLDLIEKGLVTQKQIQEKSIRMLESTFELYYHAFIALRKQFALVWYLEKSYEAQLQAFVNSNTDSQDLIIGKKKSDYETIYSDIQNKRLLIWKALLQLPITVEQNKTITTVCKNLMKEIDNTLITSFPSIRGNLVTVGAAILAQKALMTNNSTKDLEEGLARLSSKATADLAVKSEAMSGQLRLREANTMRMLVDDLANMQTDLQAAKDQTKSDYDEASSILLSATNDLTDLLNK